MDVQRRLILPRTLFLALFDAPPLAKSVSYLNVLILYRYESLFIQLGQKPQNLKDGLVLRVWGTVTPNSS